MRLPGGALLFTESLIAASWPGAHGYALAHYVSTPCGGAAVPMVWGRLFDRVWTRIDPRAHSRMWREIAPSLAHASRSLLDSPFNLEGAMAALRRWLRETAAPGQRVNGCAADAPGAPLVVGAPWPQQAPLFSQLKPSIV